MVGYVAFGCEWGWVFSHTNLENALLSNFRQGGSGSDVAACGVSPRGISKRFFEIRGRFTAFLGMCFQFFKRSCGAFEL